ncbi:hypothetical protein [Bdellovibrio sp. KM01]|uniref:hypothetical protein n=1 Tax=Bdellovibrio sp. KM01 TaxID=2748865 RepID=UPI0015E93A30|nr:hypothetical protein [Bdellovibrio sp. KM01]QLY24644.1 hypothetical protein HW988_14460 [Bdellovibrio sp. KM01]
MKNANKAVKILGSTLILLTSLSAWAEGPQCSQIFSSQVRFTIKEDGVTAKEVDVFRKVVDDLNSHLGGLVTPQNAEILVYKKHSSPAANPFQKTVVAGVHYKRTHNNKEYLKTPNFSIPILAHEYGHLIFMENYGRVEPRWTEAIESYQEVKVLRAKRASLQNENNELSDKANSFKIKNEPVPAEITDRMAAVAREIQELQQKDQELMTKFYEVWDNNTAYNEFFADVVAVMYTGKSDSVSKAVAFATDLQNTRNKKFMKQSAEQRDFENHRDHDVDMEGHNFFSISRDDIWDSYLASPTYRKEKATVMMEAVFAAVAKENSYKIDHPEIKFEDNWKMYNKRLSDAIDAEMSARGIQKLK